MFIQGQHLFRNHFLKSLTRGSYRFLNSWKSLEICPVIFQTWKKSGKWRESLGKWSWFFLSQLQKVLYEHNVFLLVKSYSILPVHLQGIMKKALFLRLLGFYWSHFDNLESGKRKYCCGKKSGKSLEFWIQKSVQTLTSAHHTGMWYYSARTLFWQLSIDHNIDVHYQVKHRLYMPLTPCL